MNRHPSPHVRRVQALTRRLARVARELAEASARAATAPPVPRKPVKRRRRPAEWSDRDLRCPHCERRFVCWGDKFLKNHLRDDHGVQSEREREDQWRLAYQRMMVGMGRMEPSVLLGASAATAAKIAEGKVAHAQ